MSFRSSFEDELVLLHRKGALTPAGIRHYLLYRNGDRSNAAHPVRPLAPRLTGILTLERMLSPRRVAHGIDREQQTKLNLPMLLQQDTRAELIRLKRE